MKDSLKQKLESILDSIESIPPVQRWKVTDKDFTQLKEMVEIRNAYEEKALEEIKKIDENRKVAHDNVWDLVHKLIGLPKDSAMLRINISEEDDGIYYIEEVDRDGVESALKDSTVDKIKEMLK